MRLVKVGFFVLAAALSGLALAQDKATIIAVYGESFDKPESAQTFRYLWNARGAVGKAENYEALPFSEKEKTYMNVGADGKHIPGTPKGNNWMCYPGNDATKDKDKTARYMIGAYTMKKDSTGNVWLVNGNLQHPYGKTEKDMVDLRIFVNDTPKQEYRAVFARIPTLFNANLGRLKKDDTLYLAVGPGDVCDADYFKLFVTIADLPEGASPPPPKNIISPPADTANPRMSADGNPLPGYLETLKSQNSALLQNMPEIVFIGDSITAAWNKEVLKEKFAKYKTMNIGLNGEVTQNVLWRVENSTLDQTKPKLIILLIGTNNLGNYYGVDEIVAGIAAILKAIKYKTPTTKVLLLGIFPRGEKTSEPINDRIRQINAKLSALADDKKVVFLDIGNKLVEADGTLAKEVFHDGLHLAKEGFIRWAEAILPTVDRIIARPEKSP